MDALSRLTLPELRRLLMLSERSVADPETVEREIREKFGVEAENWNIPKAAASVRDDIVKLISQKESELEHREG